MIEDICVFLCVHYIIITNSIQDLIARRRSLLLLSTNTDVKNGISLLEKRKGTILEPQPEPEPEPVPAPPTPEPEPES